ncbi:riboflavin synthase [Photobacterium damselae]|uniref:Riboflavin synthase n=1 Tax=Photobacterium damselae TaxID=38293 RepID=A0ABD6X7Q2_PHODM|nr:riboflavin synthase [Photobacterium damselae]OBU43521.1 riboflavin synthase subunit alpha [Photobacterium damselae]PSU19149.1 riboflavin synthase [Photobacterium damselae]
MFTRIIESIGSIIHHNEDISIVVNTNNLDISDVNIGDSIATNGVCLTVSNLLPSGFTADLSLETYKRTAFHSYRIDLEKAMLPTTRLGGHLVSGHVDGVGEVIEFKRYGRAINIWVMVPTQLIKFLSEKGSVTIDGISLTINAVYQNIIKLTIVPHTLANTNIVNIDVDKKLNIEIDMMARYLENLINVDKYESEKTSNVSMDLLERYGFIS